MCQSLFQSLSQYTARRDLLLLLLCGAGPAFSQLKPPAQKPAAAPAATTKPAAAPASTIKPDEVVQNIARCMLANAPQDWRSATLEIKETGNSGRERAFEANYTWTDAAGKVQPLAPCNPQEPAVNLYRLNETLSPEKRQWTRAVLSLTKEGKFDIKYDYTPR